MKTRTETVSIPEETYEKVTYCCEACPYESDDEDDMKAHHARNHSSKKEVALKSGSGTVGFLWFDTQEEAQLWLDHSDPNNFYDIHELKWEGAGWYGRNGYSTKGGCRCGSCYREVCLLQPLKAFVDSWKEEVAKHEETISRLKERIEETNALLSEERL